MYHYIIIALSCIPLIASLIPLETLRIQRFTDNQHSTARFALDSLVLRVLALGYVTPDINFTRLVPNAEFTAEIIRTYSSQVWMRIILIWMMWFTVFFSMMKRPNFRSEEKFDVNWALGGFIGSIVLSCNFTSNLPDSMKIPPAIRLHMFSAFLDIIAWFPQYKMTLKNERVNWPEITYIVGMFTFDILTIAGLTFQYQLSQLYRPIGFNTIVLKFIFFCCFIFEYMIKHCLAALSSQANPRETQTNNVIEVVYANSEPRVSCSDGKILDNSMGSIPEELNISMDKNKLMIPA